MKSDKELEREYNSDKHICAFCCQPVSNTFFFKEDSGHVRGECQRKVLARIRKAFTLGTP